MKLSDIKGDRVFDVIADLIDPVASIAQDAQAAALFRPAEGEQAPSACAPLCPRCCARISRI